VQKVFHSINSRILLIPIIALIALIAAGLVSIRTIANVTLEEHQARARAVTDAAAKIIEFYEGKAARGEMTDDAAQSLAKEALRAVRYDGSEYVIARRLDGVIVINGLFRDREGTPSFESKDSEGTYFGRDMVKAAEAGGGFNYYLWPKTPNTPPVRKATYSKLTHGWKWVVGSGVYLDEVDAATWASAVNTALMIGAVALLTFAAAFWLGRRITRPILRLTHATHRLAEGDATTEVPEADRNDEIGTMAQAIAILKQRSAEATRLAADQDRLKAEAALERQAAMHKLADGFEASVKGFVDTMATSASDMKVSANSMSTAAATTNGEATAAAAAAQQTSTNVETVAAATEELSSSIQEISRQIAQSSQIASNAVSEAGRANETMASLENSAKRVGDIVALISGIAKQTNLLALNATIEAARAGETGKGFAVVASEVKSLATQTAKATEEIQATVAAIQSMTGTAVSAIQGIGGIVARMNEITAAVAAAAEQQGAATSEIAGNIQQAAASAKQVSGSVTTAQGAASQTGSIAENVLSAAGRLSGEAEHLKSEVASFLAQVRAA
jgi:methyl-accepting chemotaxis protein